MVDPTGFEPATLSMPSRCSTAELRAPTPIFFNIDISANHSWLTYYHIDHFSKQDKCGGGP